MEPVELGPAASDGLLTLSLPLTNHRVIYRELEEGWAAEFDDAPYGYGGDGDFDDIIVTVAGASPPRPGGYAECDATVGRGNTVRCEMDPGVSAYTVVGRRAWGDGFNIVEAPNTFHGSEKYYWSGMAVADTRVEFTIEYNDGGRMRQRRFRTRFRVSPRSLWPQLQLRPPQTTIGIRGDMLPYPENRLLGNAATAFQAHDFLNVRVTTAPEGGPNAGLSFLRDPLPEVPYSIYVHPGLYGYPPPGARQWYDDQNGLGGGTCTISVMGALQAEVLRHEGATMEPNSHWGITQEFYATRNPHRRLEEFHAWGPPEVFRAMLWSEWVRLHDTGWHHQRQTNFDSTDIPKLVGSLGCTLDFNRHNN